MTDQAKIDALAERIFLEINGSMSVLNLYLGYKLGLFKIMAETGPVTAEALAKKSGCQERYLREWLGAMAAGGYIGYESDTKQFLLSEDQAAAYLDPSNPSHILPSVGFIPAMASILPRLLDAFRQGGGVPYEAYGRDLVDAQGAGYRPIFANELVQKWIAAMPDVQRRLSAGAKVLDVGCGAGWASLYLAQAFPQIDIQGFDSDESSIRQAGKNAEELGLKGRVKFHLSSIEDAATPGPFDLAMLFECLHDMAYPVRALQAVHRMLTTDGVVLLSDERVGEGLEENLNFNGHLYYNFSTLHCLPQALVFPNSSGTGAVISPSTVTRYASEAGFSHCQILPVEHGLFRLYRLDK